MSPVTWLRPAFSSPARLDLATRATTKLSEAAPGLSVAHASTATNANQLGGLAASGFQTRVRWAFVNASGALLKQSGGISMEAHNPASCSSVCDFLDFGSSQAGKAILVTLSGTGSDAGEVVSLNRTDSLSERDSGWRTERARQDSNL